MLIRGSVGLIVFNLIEYLNNKKPDMVRHIYNFYNKSQMMMKQATNNP